MRSKANIVACAALAGLLAACGPRTAPPSAADQPLTVTVSRVELKPLDAVLVASGVLVSEQEAAVSPQLSGYRVAKVLVDQDAWVRAGQPVAQLDDTLLRSQIDQQKANVAQQEVAAERAEQEASRVAGLDNQGVLSQEQIVERRLAARAARASVRQAQAALRDLLVREGLMTVRAPVGGRVLERNVRPGDVASPSTVMYLIDRDGIVELNAEIPQADLGRIAPGQRADVQLPSGKHVTGVIRLISPEVDQQTNLGHARVTLPVSPDLRPGGYGRASFIEVARPVIAVPEAAIHFDAEGASVMVVGPDDRVRRAAVKTGARGRGYVELQQGPAVGSRVALGGSAFVMEGDKVRVIEAAATAPQMSGAAP